MPFQTNDSLPDSVKGSLPVEAQTIWRNTFNSSYKDDIDEEIAIRTAWAAVKKAGYEKDQSGEWKKTFAETYSFEAEVFSTGKHNGDEYTQQDLKDIEHAFTALRSEIKPPVKLGHNEEQMKDILRDGQPALGWIDNLSVNGDKLIAKFIGIPKILKKAINEKRYMRVSAEILWGYRSSTKKRFRRVLSAVALLGADIPAIKNLDDLKLYFGQASDSGPQDSIKVYSQKVDDTGAIILNSDDHSGGGNMADNNNDAVLKVYQDRIDDLQTSLETEKGDKTAIQTQLDAQVKLYTQVKTALDAKDAEIKKYQDDAREATKTSRADTMKKFCEASVKSGLMTPAARDILADEGKRSYSDDSGIEFSFETVKEFVEAQGTLADADVDDAEGKHKKNKKDYTDAGVEVDARAKKYSVDHKVDYTSALTAVLEADADLAKAYIEESEGGEA